MTSQHPVANFSPYKRLLLSAEPQPQTGKGEYPKEQVTVSKFSLPTPSFLKSTDTVRDVVVPNAAVPSKPTPGAGAWARAFGRTHNACWSPEKLSFAEQQEVGSGDEAESEAPAAPASSSILAQIFQNFFLVFAFCEQQVCTSCILLILGFCRLLSSMFFGRGLLIAGAAVDNCSERLLESVADTFSDSLDGVASVLQLCSRVLATEEEQRYGALWTVHWMRFLGCGGIADSLMGFCGEPASG